ncbi:MAG: hypothetical protein ACK4FG_01240 [Brevundimonas sp.]
MTVIAALAVALNLLLAQAVPELTQARIAKLEDGLDLNALLASPLAVYVFDENVLPPVSELSRNYEIGERDGRPVIIARYTYAIAEDDPFVLDGTYCCGSPSPPGAHIGPGRSISDGGCGVVWVTFDVRTDRPISVWCQGGA